VFFIVSAGPPPNQASREARKRATRETRESIVTVVPLREEHAVYDELLAKRKCS